MSLHTSGTTKIDVYELHKNGESLFSKFIKEIEFEGNSFNKLAGAIRIIEGTANLIRFPKNKFREIEGHKLNCKIFEVKSGEIRVYLFQEEKTGRVIVTGGLKNSQKKDIKAIINTIKEYYHDKQ